MTSTPGLQLDNFYFAERLEAALDYARRNALRRFVRCLFAEKIIDRKQLIFTPQDYGVLLPVWERQAMLYFEDLRHAPANTFVNRGPIILIERNGTRSLIDAPDRLIEVLRDSFNFQPSPEGIAGLKADIANSIKNDALARTYREIWNRELERTARNAGCSGLVEYLHKHCSTRDAAMLLDQWGSLEGHPFYPTWKSKPNLQQEEVIRLSPEFAAKVSLRIASLRADQAYMERMAHVGSYHGWFAENFPELHSEWKSRLTARGLAEEEWLPLPIHAWHLENYVKQEYADEIASGLLILDGPDLDTAPTMSFRTMLPAQPGDSPFIKLPVAIWLTSEQRSLQAKSIHMGPRISTVISDILAAENGFDKTLEIFPEELGFHYKNAVTQEDRPGRHLSVVFRKTRDAFGRADGLLPVAVAALFSGSPSQGRPLVTELIEKNGARASAEQVERFFRQYARVVTHPVLSIYMLYGIALEAHQQNTSVLFSPDGTPRGLLIRDFGDGRTFAPLLRERGYDLKPYVHKGILPTVFEEDIEPVRSFVIDACFVCHLHELALVLTAEYGLRSGRLWQILREETERAFEAVAPRVSGSFWETERTEFLEKPWQTRSVLKMHLLQYSDYRLQHHLPNPLASLRNQAIHA